MYIIFSIPNTKKYNFETEIQYDNSSYWYETAIQIAVELNRKNKERQTFITRIGMWTILPFYNLYINFSKNGETYLYEIKKTLIL